MPYLVIFRKKFEISTLELVKTRKPVQKNRVQFETKYLKSAHTNLSKDKVSCKNFFVLIWGTKNSYLGI